MSKRDRQRGLTVDLQQAVIPLVKVTREALGLTTAELARQLGVTDQTVRYVWEAEPRPLSFPTGLRLQRVTRWLLHAERLLRRRGKVRASLVELLSPEARAAWGLDRGLSLAKTIRALEEGASTRILRAIFAGR